MKSFFPAVLSFAIFFIACGDNSSSVSAGNSHNENSSLSSSSDTPMSNDGETSEFSSSAKSSSNSAKSTTSENEQGDGGSEAAVTSSSSVAFSSSDTSTSSSSEEKSKTSSSSVETDAEIMPLGTYDCTEHKCLTTEFLNQDFLEAGKYSEILDQKSDIVYKVIKIGDQWWTAQNVYNPFGTCFDDMKSNCDIYGSLYDWPSTVAMRASECIEKQCPLPQGFVRGKCAKGWHVPDTTEWIALFAAIGGKSAMQEVLKSKVGWKDEVNCTDLFGFSAVPGGIRFEEGIYSSNGTHAQFWSSTELDARESKIYTPKWAFVGITLDGNYPIETEMMIAPKGQEHSIRCVKD